MIFFQVYQYIAPLVLFPLSYGLWWNRFDGDHRMVLMSLSFPIVFAYVIPGLGTNWLRLWEFNTRFRLGRFRPHHGLLFGTATSLFALIALPVPTEFSVATVLRDAFVLGTVLAFWNWLYDIYAIKAGFISVYTRTQHEGAGPEAVATEYAPLLFGAFGCCYAIALRSVEYWMMEWGRWSWSWMILLILHLVCLTVPVLAYITVSYLRTGESGLRSYEGAEP